MFIDDPKFIWRKFTRDEYQHQVKITASLDKEVEKAKALFHKDKPNFVLSHQEPLPLGINKVPEDLLDTPICEPDPYYKHKFTYVVLRKSRFKRSITLFRYSSQSSLGIFSPFNLLRRLCIHISTSFIFSSFIFLTIITNCVFLSLSVDQQLSETSDVVFTIIYIIEFFIRLISQGLILGSHTYFKDTWQWLDFSVISISVIFYAVIWIAPDQVDSTSSGFTSFRTFRVLRALKSLSIVPGLRTIVSALLACMKPVLEVLFIMVFLVLTIAILGMQSYRGVLRTRCVETNVVENALVTNYSDYLANTQVRNEINWFMPGEEEQVVCQNNTFWPGSCPNNFTCVEAIGENPNNGLTSFDNIGLAMLTCFQLVTLDYWENVYNMILRTSGLAHFVYFLFVILLGPFYLLNLLLAVVTLAYSEATTRQKKQDKERLRFHKKYAHAVNNLSQIEIEDEQPFILYRILNSITKNLKTCFSIFHWPKFMKWLPSSCRKLIANKYFDHFITFCILANTIILSIETHDQSKLMDDVIFVINAFFTFVFLIEILLKLCGLGPIKCLQDSINMFDFVVAFVGLFDFIAYYTMDRWRSGLTVVKSLRLLRVFRLAQKWNTMKRLLAIVFDSVSQVAYLTVVLFVVLFIFAIIGKSLYADSYREFTDISFKNSTLLYPDNNVEVNTAPRWSFESFGSSFVLVFRVLCGEWVEPLYDCYKIADTISCVPFFILITLVANFLVFNLFVAILLEAFNVENLRKETEKDCRKKKAKRKLIWVIRSMQGLSSTLSNYKSKAKLSKMRKLVGKPFMITKIFNTRNNRKVGDESEQVNHDRSEDLDTDLNMEIDSQANVGDVTMSNINGVLKEPGSLRDLEKMVESSQDIGVGGFSFLFLFLHKIAILLLSFSSLLRRSS